MFSVHILPLSQTIRPLRAVKCLHAPGPMHMSIADFVLGRNFQPSYLGNGRTDRLEIFSDCLIRRVFRLPPVRPRSDCKRGSWERTPNFSVPNTPQRVPISTWGLEFLGLLGNVYRQIDFGGPSLSRSAPSESLQNRFISLVFHCFVDGPRGRALAADGIQFERSIFYETD
jgi:hypothetical protein